MNYDAPNLMAIAAGTRLGPYEILSPLGAGGMGEVYKARDTRLERDVAIKVLPPHLSENAEFRQRFEREAKAISQLSHPHVCALYDVGRQDGVEYLVMELLEGQTLADRLDRGALALEQTLRVGVEIADALEKAHRRGIVHRDLKPGNVMLTKSGVKLLDFGLAKTVAPEREAAFTSLPTEADRPLTEKGTVMGTFQYMAPEQLEGKEADSRSDIFALGCVLYEMATGKKAFSGSSRASMIAAILEREPPLISTIVPMTPPALERVVKTCLAKDPDERWQSAHDVKSELAWIAEAGSQAGAPAAVASRRRSRERLAWAGFALSLAGLLVFAALWLRGRGSDARILRAAIDLPEKADFSLYLDPVGPGRLSPDGRSIAFTAVRDGKYQVWIRSLDSLEARPLAGTENGSYPFWSPDSQWLAFFAAGKLQKIAASGGAPQVLAEAPNGRGGDWNRAGVILFSPDAFGGLVRVSADGGAVQAVTKLRPMQSTHRWPSFLPDGKHFLFYASSGQLHGLASNDGVYAGALDSTRDTFLFAADSEAVFSEGYVVLVHANTLQAIPFDPTALRAKGEPIAIASPVQRDFGRMYGMFSVSPAGLLAYHGGATGLEGRLAWLDRSGRRLETFGEPGLYSDPSVSPDGSRIAVGLANPVDLRYQILIFPGNGAPPTPFTFGPASNGYPVWSRDGSEIAFSSSRTGEGDLYSKAVTGRQPDRLRVPGSAGYPTDWSPDGRFLAYGSLRHSGGSSRTELWIAPLSPGTKPYKFAGEGIKEPIARFSPDGQWIAYNSYESGVSRIYVAPFPEGSGRWQVSTGDGYQPRWRRDGKAIFYVSGDNALFEAALSTSGGFQVGAVKELFRLKDLPQTAEWHYDVSPDGNRFLFVVSAENQPTSSAITLVTNWARGLRK